MGVTLVGLLLVSALPQSALGETLEMDCGEFIGRLKLTDGVFTRPSLEVLHYNADRPRDTASRGNLIGLNHHFPRGSTGRQPPNDPSRKTFRETYVSRL